MHERDDWSSGYGVVHSPNCTRVRSWVVMCGYYRDSSEMVCFGVMVYENLSRDTYRTRRTGRIECEDL